MTNPSLLLACQDRSLFAHALDPAITDMEFAEIENSVRFVVPNILGHGD